MSEQGTFLGEQPGIVAERTSGVIVRLVRTAIIEGRLEPGQSLREEQLAKELGTSRTPVREALIQLRNEGLVEGAPNRPAIVRSYSAAELLDIYRLRAQLEGFAARVAAERGGTDLVRKLDASNERFHALTEHEDDAADLIAENISFHALIAEAAAIRQLDAMINQVMAIPARYRAFGAYRSDTRTTVEEHHRAITEAIRIGDGDAAATAMAEHVLWTGEVAVTAQEAFERDAAASA
jgi:DNA-binding GntR family transcriptional regulator